jgi:tetratricopeptide (TPR) repeat protein/ribosome biogenesis GTPase A
VGIFDRLADQLGELIVPDHVRVHVDVGAAMLERGDLDDAVRELARAVELMPEHARAMYLLGLAHARRGDGDDAACALARAAELREGDFPEALLALAEVQRKIGRLDDAAESFRRAIDAGLDDQARADACRGLGEAHFSLGRFDKAVRELRKAAAARPDDPDIRGLLGRALLARGDLETARVALERAAQAEATGAALSDGAVAALAALGELYRRTGRPTDAESAYERALAAGPRGAITTAARLGLGQARLDAGDAAGGHRHALEALAESPDDPRAHHLLGRALVVARSWEPALAAFDRAAERSTGDLRDALLDEALHVALKAGLVERAAENNSQSPPADALAAVALGRLAAGDTTGAADLVGRALAAGDSVEVRLAQARVQRALGHTVAAAVTLRLAAELVPGDPRPRALLVETYRAGDLPHDLYGLLRATHRRLLDAPELGDLAPEAARTLEILDRPLLVTVMGEFNSGKSTFVNALVGEEVAPMGITPTSATINVWKYGAERGGRVVYRDDTTRDLAWEEVPALLRGLDEAEARRIRMVEVLYPLDTLARVNVVDTPGLNSILPEHEETAREFIGQSDAIVWLFSVGQAGKATEREALARIQGEHKKALGVVNKIDRTDEAGLAEILAHLEASFGDLVEALVPFSAREALLGRGDPARLERSNRAALERALEERFFARAKSIKREAAARRALGLLDQASSRAEGLATSTRQSELDAALAAVRAEQVLFHRRFLGEERLRLIGDLDALYAAATREVLDFVRPRSWPFGSHQATAADRDFLVGLFDEKLGALADASRARVAALADRSLGALRPVSTDAPGGEHLRILDEQVYGRWRAFTRGYLRGGRVDDFFTRVLPKLELGEPAIRRALERDMPHLDVVDAELLAPLRAWGERLFADLQVRLLRLAQAEELRRFDVEERLLHPIASLRAALDAVGR